MIIICCRFLLRHISCFWGEDVFNIVNEDGDIGEYPLVVAFMTSLDNDDDDGDIGEYPLVVTFTTSLDDDNDFSECPLVVAFTMS